MHKLKVAPPPLPGYGTGQSSLGVTISFTGSKHPFCRAVAMVRNMEMIDEYMFIIIMVLYHIYRSASTRKNKILR